MDGESGSIDALQGGGSSQQHAASSNTSTEGTSTATTTTTTSKHPLIELFNKNVSAVWHSLLSTNTPTPHNQQRNTVIFIDNGFADIIKSNFPGGTVAFIQAQQRHLLRLWSIQPDTHNNIENIHLPPLPRPNASSTSNPLNAIFLLSSFITDYQETIRHILHAHPFFNHIRILTSVSEQAHLYHQTGFVDEAFVSWQSQPFEKLKADISSDLPHPVTIEVRHFPVAHVPLLDDLFLLVGCDALFPKIDIRDRRSTSMDRSSQMSGVGGFPPLSGLSRSLESLNATDRNHILFASHLSSIINHFNVKEEIFAIGATSRSLAKTLITLGSSSNSQAQLRRKSPDTSNAALVLLDRTVDLIPALSQPDSLLDLVFHTQSKVSENSVDVCTQGSDFFNHPIRVSLSHGHDPLCSVYWNQTASMPLKDALAYTRKRLLDVIESQASDYKIPRLLGKVSLSQLTKFLSALKALPLQTKESMFAGKSEYGRLVEAFVLVIQSWEAATGQKFEELTGAVKVLVLSLSSEQGNMNGASMTLPELFVKTIRELMATFPAATSGGSNIPYHFLMTLFLALVLFRPFPMNSEEVDEMMGVDTVTQEVQQMLLIDTILQQFRAAGVLNMDDQNVIRILRVVEECARMRAKVIQSNTNLSVLQHVLTTVSPYAEHIPFGTAEKLLGGFSRFVLGSSIIESEIPSFPVVILAIVGGVTGEEVRRVREIVEWKRQQQRQPGYQVFIVSNTVATGKMVVERILDMSRG